MSDEGQGSPREYAARVTIRDKHDARLLSYGATRFLKELEGSEKHSPKQSGEGREIGEIRCHSERGWRVVALHRSAIENGWACLGRKLPEAFCCV